MTQAVWLYRPPTWHPRPRRVAVRSVSAAGTLALSSAGYEIGDGNSPATMAVESSVAFDVAIYPLAQWPLSSAAATRTSQTTDSNGRLSNISDASLTAGSTYRVVIRRVSDGECWTFTMAAT